MSEIISESFSESQLNILKILSALAWADGSLSKEEIGILLQEFKDNLPMNNSSVSPQEYPNLTGFNLDVDLLLIEQIEQRANAELAFKKIINDYHDNPIPITDLVSQIKTIEDKCLTVKLSYLVIGVNNKPSKRAVYRQLIQLFNLDDNLVKEIEWEASQELEKFQHPFKALMTNLKNFLYTEI